MKIFLKISSFELMSTSDFDFLTKLNYQTSNYKNMIMNYWKFYDKNNEFVTLTHKCGYTVTKHKIDLVDEWCAITNKQKNYLKGNDINA